MNISVREKLTFSEAGEYGVLHAKSPFLNHVNIRFSMFTTFITMAVMLAQIGLPAAAHGTETAPAAAPQAAIVGLTETKDLAEFTQILHENLSKVEKAVQVKNPVDEALPLIRTLKAALQTAITIPNAFHPDTSLKDGDFRVSFPAPDCVIEICYLSTLNQLTYKYDWDNGPCLISIRSDKLQPGSQITVMDSNNHQRTWQIHSPVFPKLDKTSEDIVRERVKVGPDTEIGMDQYTPRSPREENAPLLSRLEQ
jgi:hypothetical protein